MGTTAEKLQKILDTKADLKASIIAKGGTITDDTPFSEYASQVDSLASGGEDVTDETNTYTSLLSQLETTIDSLPEAADEINLQSKTVTPTTSSQNITPDEGYDGLSEVTVSGDSNLVPSNIKSGVSIFGVNGTYEGSGGGSSGTTSIQTGYVTNMFRSTAEGIVIFTRYNQGQEYLEFSNLSFQYLGGAYRAMIGDNIPYNSQITVLTTGTIQQLPAVENGELQLVTSGTGYYIYKVVESTGGGSGDEDDPS